ncbi:histidine phosphatase family protein [Bacillus sp. Marseille-Q1617]|uniref:histidine phosphatase family protein n=1 Tax=Bacillus sp. Marseille-Q1617 TaxID=2736887 RepID=UPI00158BDA03|nr:histidine phosphatase family protein [Bacillus sp. Marseille-Q1617]
MEILLVRHGESEADILNVHEGRADFSLTERGVRQVEAMAKRVKEEFPPDLIWCSTLKRARETAEKLAEEVGCELIYHEDLMEHNNGVLAGLSFKEAEKIPMPRHLHESVENGESRIEFRMRIEMIFSKIMADSNVNRLAIVAHGGVINNLLRSFLRMPIDAEIYFHCGDTTLHLLEVTNRGRAVRFMNDTNHLKDL